MMTKRYKIASILFAAVLMIACCLISMYATFWRTDKAGLGGDGDPFYVMRETADSVRLLSTDSEQVVTDRDSLFRAVSRVKTAYGIEDPEKSLSFSKAIAAPFGTVYKLTQKYGKYAVYGRSVSVAVDRAGRVLSISGNYRKDVCPVNRIRYSAKAAMQAASEQFEGEAVGAFTEIYSLNGSQPRYAHVVYSSFGSGTQIVLDAETLEQIAVFSSAQDSDIPTEPYVSQQYDYYGKLVEAVIEKTVSQAGAADTYYLADCLRNIYIIDNKNSYDLDGKQYESADGIFADKVAVLSFLNFVKAYDFYADAVNIGVSRKGIDGNHNDIHDDEAEAGEMAVYAYLHYGSEYSNAGFLVNADAEDKNAYFIFGDGNKTNYFDYAISADVVGHEYQHAITASTANLIYQNASGAINEGISDIFGALIEGHALGDDEFWQMGEDIINKTYGYAMRDMKNPLALEYPDKMNGRYFEDYCFKSHRHSSCDNGGVHTNSSVITHAAYQMWNLKPQLFTKEVMGTLWYTTLLLLPQDADFSDLRVMMRQAALSLGYSEEMLETIGAAFDNAGIAGDEGLHTVEFLLSGETGVAPASITRNYGEPFTIPSSDIEKTNYEFYAWAQGSLDLNKAYFENVTYRMPASDMTLRPQFAIPIWNGCEVRTWSGSGDYSDPYLIRDEADLATLGYYLNNGDLFECPQPLQFRYFKMTADLNFQNIPWIPISGQSYQNMLNGLVYNFDGDGHKILNLAIESNLYGFTGLGLFGVTDADISNLTVESGRIAGSARYIGAIAGSLFGDIENCVNNAEIISGGGTWVGGVAGDVLSIKNSRNNGNIVSESRVTAGVAGGVSYDVSDCSNTGNIAGRTIASGIVGEYSPFGQWVIDLGGSRSYSEGVLKVGNCYNTGTITGEFAGGIGGNGTNVYYANCVNLGTIQAKSGTSAVGGIVADIGEEGSDLASLDTFVLGCKNTGMITPGDCEKAGGIVGNAYRQKGQGFLLFKNNVYKAQAELSDIGNFDRYAQYMEALFQGERAKSSQSSAYEGDFDFDNAAYYENPDNWVNTDWSLGWGIGYEREITALREMPALKTPEYWVDCRAESFAGGDGSRSSPYRIANARQLALMAWIYNHNGGKFNDRYVGNYYRLIGDIDLSGKIWSGVGYSYREMLQVIAIVSGNSLLQNIHFDGGGYTIANMYARRKNWREESYNQSFESKSVITYTSEAGLFSNIYSSDIKNIVFKNCNILGENAGAIAAEMVCDNSIVNCRVESGVVGGEIAGAFVGYCENAFNDKNSFERLYSNAEVVGGLVSGGIIGEVKYRSGYSGADGKIDVKGVVNEGKITCYGENGYGNYSSAYAGGIIGKATNNSVTLKNCINTGAAINHDSFGSAAGIIGIGGKLKLIVSNAVQSGVVAGRNTAFTSIGGVAAISPYASTQKAKIDAEIFDSHFAGILKAVSSLASGTENFNVIERNVVQTNDPAAYDYGSRGYFKSQAYFDSLDAETADFMYGNMNGVISLTFYVDGVYYQTIFAEVGERVALPMLGGESSGFGGWTISIDGVDIDCGFYFVADRDTVFTYDAMKENHYWGEWTIDREATCAAEGSRKRVSNYHAAIVEYQAIEKTEHKYEFKSSVAVHWEECVNCGIKMNFSTHYFNTSSNKTGHWDECGDCGRRGVVAVHCFTMTQSGTTHAQICDVCNYRGASEEHIAGEWIVVKNPTETEYGLKERHCTVCGHIMSIEQIKKLGSDNKIIWAVVGSCAGVAAVGAVVTGILLIVKRRRKR